MLRYAIRKFRPRNGDRAESEQREQLAARKLSIRVHANNMIRAATASQRIVRTWHR
jgi:hypothetical protein